MVLLFVLSLDNSTMFDVVVVVVLFVGVVC